MPDLATWLRDQLDEDERVARAATPGQWAVFVETYDVVEIRTAASREDRRGPTDQVVTPGDYEAVDRPDAEHIARHDPARILAEVAAKRAIIDFHDPGPGWGYCAECVDPTDSDLKSEWPCWHIRVLAVPYAGEPGYLDEWRVPELPGLVTHE